MVEKKDDGDTGDEREAADRKLLQDSRQEGNSAFDHRGRSGGGQNWVCFELTYEQWNV